MIAVRYASHTEYPVIAIAGPINVTIPDPITIPTAIARDLLAPVYQALVLECSRLSSCYSFFSLLCSLLLSFIFIIYK